MVIANLSDGTTAKFDLSEGSQHQALLTLLASGQVSALALHHHGIQHTLPAPRRFRQKPLYGAEAVFNGGPSPIGERIYAQADEVRVSLTAMFRSKLIRCDLVRTGSMKYNPG